MALNGWPMLVVTVSACCPGRSGHGRQWVASRCVGPGVVEDARLLALWVRVVALRAKLSALDAGMVPERWTVKATVGGLRVGKSGLVHDVAA